jgi:hypothetical protein
MFGGFAGHTTAPFTVLRVRSDANREEAHLSLLRLQDRNERRVRLHSRCSLPAVLMSGIWDSITSNRREYECNDCGALSLDPFPEPNLCAACIQWELRTGRRVPSETGKQFSGVLFDDAAKPANPDRSGPCPQCVETGGRCEECGPLPWPVPNAFGGPL